MSIEIEKKFRLNDEMRQNLRIALKRIGARFAGREFEENVIYTSETLRVRHGVIRLRYVNERTILTFKRRTSGRKGFKEQIEHETEIADAESIRAIFDELQIRPVLIYEKFRETWHLGSTEVVLDELPFGLFMEIEGSPTDIEKAERLLGVEHQQHVEETYPNMTARLGKKRGEVTESRFISSTEEE